MHLRRREVWTQSETRSLKVSNRLWSGTGNGRLHLTTLSQMLAQSHHWTLMADVNKERRNGNVLNHARPCSGHWAPHSFYLFIFPGGSFWMAERVVILFSAWPFCSPHSRLSTPIHPSFSPSALSLPPPPSLCAAPGMPRGWWICGSPAVWLQDRGGHF